MTWEWVAPLSTLTTGVFGMFFTYKTSKRQQDSQFNLLTKQVKSQQYTDLYQRRRQLYSDFLGMTHTALATGKMLKTSSEVGLLAVLNHLREQGVEVKDGKVPPEYSDMVERALTDAMKKNFGIESDSKFSSVSLEQLITVAISVQLISESNIGTSAMQTAQFAIDYLLQDKHISEIFNRAELQLKKTISLMQRNLNPDADPLSQISLIDFKHRV